MKRVRILKILSTLLILSSYSDLNISQVSSYRKSKNLFVALKTPFKPVGGKTLARWLTHLMGLAGVDTSTFCQHSARSAAAAYHKEEKSLCQSNSQTC